LFVGWFSLIITFTSKYCIRRVCLLVGFLWLLPLPVSIVSDEFVCWLVFIDYYLHQGVLYQTSLFVGCFSLIITYTREHCISRVCLLVGFLWLLPSPGSIVSDEFVCWLVFIDYYLLQGVLYQMSLFVGWFSLIITFTREYCIRWVCLLVFSDYYQHQGALYQSSLFVGWFSLIITFTREYCIRWVCLLVFSDYYLHQGVLYQSSLLVSFLWLLPSPGSIVSDEFVGWLVRSFMTLILISRPAAVKWSVLKTLCFVSSA